MKNKMFICFLFLITSLFKIDIYSQTQLDELIIMNENITDTIVVKVIPIGFIFGGDSSYRPNSKFDDANNIFGGHKKLFFQSGQPELKRFGLNHDALALSSGDSVIGYGKYKVEIYRIEIIEGTSINVLKDTLHIDFSDSDYPYGESFPFSGFSNDFVIYYYNPDSIFVKFFCQNCEKIKLDTTDKMFEIWNQEIGNGSKYSKVQNKYGFKSNQNFTTYPIISINHGSHIFPFDLFLHLLINHNVNTRDTMIDNPTNIAITKNVFLKLNSSIICSLKTPLYPPLGSNNLIIQDSALLYLSQNSKIVVGNQNKLTLKNKGKITLWSNSEIRFQPGSLFCNEGGKIISAGSPGGIICYEPGFHYYNCSELSDLLIEDSTRLVLDENAIVQIPNNIEIHINGIASSLILNPGSKLLFGENSGIVCDSGGKVIANNATFASSDSTKKWNGISLSGLSQDTIKSCTIKNAEYGISISNKYDSEESPFPYSTEISGCTFINQTAYVLNSAVYIAGSNNILIMNNTISSVILEKGFTHGIYDEYCPEGAFNIIGNNISSAGFGMTLIGCSPFVVQNTLTGNEYSDCGLFLDNSNGTFEYNVISDFYYSYFLYYSSPDLLKNVFDNYYNDNIWLSSSSVPVMHPLINAGSVYWYAGDNTIKGSPSDAGIIFEEDAYPMLNYGYNKFMMTINDYYISGTNPSGGNREFYVIQNYWGGTPDSNKFNVYNADVIYIPFYSSGVYFCILETGNFHETKRMILLK